MSKFLGALAIVGVLAAASAAPANAADGCGWDRHYSPFFGRCVWNGRDHDETFFFAPARPFFWWRFNHFDHFNHFNHFMR